MTLKRCTVCEIEKPITEFTDGKCKSCKSACAKEYRKNNPEKTTWHQINSRAGNRHGDHPAYSHVEVRMEKQEFFDWYNLNYFPGCSVDRIDSTGHYELSNIQMTTLLENTVRTRKNIRPFCPEGTTWCSRCKQTFPLSSFSNSADRNYGKALYCKPCASAYNNTDKWRTWRREYMRQYRAAKRLAA